jgi:hypothetical protein
MNFIINNSDKVFDVTPKTWEIEPVYITLSYDGNLNYKIISNVSFTVTKDMLNVPDLDENGNQKKDENGNPLYKHINYVIVNGGHTAYLGEKEIDTKTKYSTSLITENTSLKIDAIKVSDEYYNWESSSDLQYTFWFEPSRLSTNLKYVMPVRFLVPNDNYKYKVDLGWSDVFTIIGDASKINSMKWDTWEYEIDGQTETESFSLVADTSETSFRKINYVLVKYDGQNASIVTDTTQEGTYYRLYTFYIVANATDEGTWTKNILITKYENEDEINNNEYTLISVGGTFYDENEILKVNGTNMGINLPKDVCKAFYNTGFYEYYPDNKEMTEKLKELLLNYMGIKGECGNYNSVIKSLEWFGWGDNVSLSQLLVMNENIQDFYFNDFFNISSDIFANYSNFRRSTYLSLKNYLNKYKYNENLPNFNNEFWYTNIEEDGEILENKVLDFSFEELSLKLQCVASVLETVFLPVHLNIYSASPVEKIGASPLKLCNTTSTNIYNFNNNLEDNNLLLNFDFTSETTILYNTENTSNNYIYSYYQKEDTENPGTYINVPYQNEVLNPINKNVLKLPFTITAYSASPCKLNILLAKTSSDLTQSFGEEIFSTIGNYYLEDAKDYKFIFTFDPSLKDDFDIFGEYCLHVLVNNVWYEKNFTITENTFSMDFGKLTYSYKQQYDRQVLKFNDSVPTFNMNIRQPNLVTINSSYFDNYLANETLTNTILDYYKQTHNLYVPDGLKNLYMMYDIKTADDKDVYVTEDTVGTKKVDTLHFNGETEATKLGTLENFYNLLFSISDTGDVDNYTQSSSIWKLVPSTYWNFSGNVEELLDFDAYIMKYYDETTSKYKLYLMLISPYPYKYLTGNVSINNNVTITFTKSETDSLKLKFELAHSKSSQVDRLPNGSQLMFLINRFDYISGNGNYKFQKDDIVISKIITKNNLPYVLNNKLTWTLNTENVAPVIFNGGSGDLIYNNTTLDIKSTLIEGSQFDIPSFEFEIIPGDYKLLIEYLDNNNNVINKEYTLKPVSCVKSNTITKIKVTPGSYSETVDNTTTTYSEKYKIDDGEETDVIKEYTLSDTPIIVTPVCVSSPVKLKLLDNYIFIENGKSLPGTEIICDTYRKLKVLKTLTKTFYGTGLLNGAFLVDNKEVTKINLKSTTDVNILLEANEITGEGAMYTTDLPVTKSWKTQWEYSVDVEKLTYTCYSDTIYGIMSNTNTSLNTLQPGYYTVKFYYNYKYSQNESPFVKKNAVLIEK